MSTLAVILIVVAGVLLAGAVVIAIACAVMAGQADELLERAYEQDPPAGSVQAAVDELGAGAERAWPAENVVRLPRRPNGGGWAA
jgi:flagellar basal body-associated protein FliL